MSKPRLVVEFTKMQAAGNDFIVLDNRFYYFTAEELSDLATTQCDRHFGIGADGLIVLGATASEENQVTMRHYNPDGKEATLCGNGARCAALYALNAGMVQGDDVQLLARIGLLTAHVKQSSHGADHITVKMPIPRKWRLVNVETQGLTIPVAQVWTGTEHAVYEKKEGVAFLEFASMLRAYENMGEQGVNVNQLEVTGPNSARIRTYEKGVEGETLACGTGAVAAAEYLFQLNRETDIRLQARGGELRAYKHEGDWYLEGPAAVVYRGTFEYESHT